MHLKNLVYRGEKVAYTVKKFGDHRERRSYSKTENAIELNNLLEIQKKSYDWFMTEGIKEVFDDIFPVESFTGNLTLEFGEYSFEEPRYSIKGCKDRYATYAAPIKVQARLFNQETGEVKEQEIYLGDMPIMTDSGTFIINGAERVIVSQLVRSPSVYFSRDVDKKNGKVLVEGINMITKHTKPSQANPNGGIVQKEAPIDASNVMLVYNGKATRVGFDVKDGKKVRVAKATGEVID